MALVRLVHPRDYDANLGRFTSLAYKNLNGGMSVFLEDCGVQKTGGACAHAAQWYSTIVGDPIIFFVIENGELPAGVTVAETLSASGDDCHRDVVGATNGQLKAALKGKNPGQFMICEGGRPRALTVADLEALAARAS